MVGHLDQVEDEVGPVTWNDGGPQRGRSSGPSPHLISPSSGLTSDLLLTKARKPRSRLAEELRDPWDSRRKAEFDAPPPSSRGEGE